VRSWGLGRRGANVGRYTGQLNLEIPPYLKIDHDTEARKAVLTVEDNFVKQQREMWGEFAFRPLGHRTTD
jgi:large subunit ribosomal protein L6